MGRWRSRIVWSVLGLVVVTGSVLMLGHPNWQLLDPPYLIVAAVCSPFVLAAIVTVFREFDSRRAQIGAVAGLLQLGMFAFAGGAQPELILRPRGHDKTCPNGRPSAGRP